MLPLTVRKKLTTWLIDQRRIGNASPLITAEVIKQVQLLPALQISARLERALLFLEKATSRAGMIVKFWGIQDDTTRFNLDGFTAWTECADANEASGIGDLLADRAEAIRDSNGLRLTAKGWEAVERLRTAPAETATGFVAMWFGDEVAEAYDNGIAPGIRDAGWTPVRIDQKEHANKIDDEIIAEIRRARFIVADFTSEPDKPRGGVYFEAGFAMGLNKPVIWTCRADMIEKVHFDTRQYNHITWESPEELRRKLKARIGAVIGDGPSAPQPARV